MTFQDELDNIRSKLLKKMGAIHISGMTHFKKDPLVIINAFALIHSHKNQNYYKKLEKHEQDIIKLSGILKQNDLIVSENINVLNSLWIQSAEQNEDAIEELMLTLESDYFYRATNTYEIGQVQFVDLVENITDQYRRSPNAGFN